MNRCLTRLIALAVIHTLWFPANLRLQADEVEFSVEVMALLSKAGCNAGVCHGNLNGKGGLKLSLRGQDANFDHASLAVAARGRRVNCASPPQSLLLQKATGQLAHGGGRRMEVGSWQYRLLSNWLAAGAPGPRPEAPQLTRLQVEPSAAIVEAPQQSVQVAVTAWFSDGSRRDVTDRACYELSNLNATVDTHGRVTQSQFGETTLIVRYLNQQLPVSLAFIAPPQDFQWQPPPANNFVDAHIFAKLQRMKINASPLCDDHVFVRRAFVDAIGRGPTAQEASRFVANLESDKRARLIDDLLARPEFSDYWALKWADVLRAEEKVLDPTGVDHFHAWIRDCIAEGLPLDRFARSLVTGVGSTFQHPAANFYRANRDAVTRGETAARLFLGIRLQCAKCHNHPFDHWTQDDYYQWSSIFSQIDYDLGENKRNDKLDKNEFAGEQIVLVSKQPEIRNPTTGEIASPKFLGGPTLSGAKAADRLQAVAEWMTAPDNQLFAKSQANFVWFHLMGRGLVDPLDDFRLTNPASHPGLLDALAEGLKADDFDLRNLVRTIMNSRTYQLASEPNSSNREDETCYSRALVRRLPAEVILDLQSDVLGLPAEFLGYPSGMRAVQIPGVQRRAADGGRVPQAGDRFLKTFGKPERIMACECERTNETTLKQAFVLLGDGLNARLASQQGRIAAWAARPRSDADLVDDLFWTALARPASPAEKAAAVELLQSTADSRAEALQDIAWSLLNAKEFLFRR